MHWCSRRYFAILLLLCAGGVSGTARPDHSTALTLHVFPRQTPSSDPLHAYVLDWAARSVTAINAAGRPVRVGSYGPESIMRRGPFSGNSPITFNVFAQE